MDVRQALAKRLVLLAVAAAAMSVGGAVTAPVAAADGTTGCAPTVTTPGPSSPLPGQPCWTDVVPYPFGINGDAIDPSSALCAQIAVEHNPGDPTCELTVNSMAFRAWNRGLAAMQGITPYAVWLFNGTRWYPDPTYPGQSVCSGNTVLWAGKLDYWLIGSGSSTSGASGLCRYDGVNYVWDSIAIPPASLARVPGGASFGFNAGACFAWNNCWFFGDYGVVDHWDGQSLTDASPGLGSSPWLRGEYKAAATGVDLSGNPFGLAVGAATENGAGALPAAPDGTPPPQMLGSLGAAFSPVANNPVAQLWASNPTDLVAVGADAAGGGWVAGNPEGQAPSGNVSGQRGAPGPAPLVRVSARAGAVPCGGYDAATDDGDDTFSFNPFGSGLPSWLWQAVSVFPGSGAALAGGQYTSGMVGADPNDGSTEPVLVTASCGQAPRVVRFVIPDPADAGQSSAPLVPADAHGYVTNVAANADNDAWAATTSGELTSPNTRNERPHVYRLTDGQPPDAAAGNDNETRPIVFTVDPPIYVQSPGVVEPPPPVITTTSTTTTTTTHKTLKPAIYDVKPGKPTVGRRGRITLKITFKVRRAVTIGIEALRKRTVVSSSGLKHFTGKTGTLTLTLNRHRWPTHLQYITPPAAKPTAAAAAAAPAKAELTWTARLPS